MKLSRSAWISRRIVITSYSIHYTKLYEEFSFLQGKGLLFADNQSAIDTIHAHWDDIFVRGNFGVYEKAQYASVRKTWERNNFV